MKLILASGSPYRKELLQRLNIPFDVVVSKVDEDALKNSIAEPLQLAAELSYRKAQDVMERSPEAAVIGADQLGVLEGKFLNKPYTPEKACEMLQTMQGKEHQLITSICLLYGEQRFQHTDVTRLTMRHLSSSEIERYVQADCPLDCAGSYKLEKMGIALFSKIESEDFSAIQGLPLMALTHILLQLGLKLP